jgi:TetR/AcrR family transcriptional repressor of nem operon
MLAEPKTERGRQSRNRIVASADALVAAHGAEGVSLDEILAAAGASKSQLYHYFSGKDELVRSVIARRGEHVLGAQMPLLTQLDNWETIERWLNLILEGHETQGLHGCPLGTLANELADRDEHARRDLADWLATWERYLADGLQRMRARGDLVAGADPQELATAVFASMQGGFLLAKTRRDPSPLRIALDAALAHLRSFAPSRPRSK